MSYQPGLFAPPAQPTLAARRTAAVSRGNEGADPDIDPCGHLADCAVEECADCRRLKAAGFVPCRTCGAWGLTGTRYDGRCEGCHVQAGGEVDDRHLAHPWPAVYRLPAGSATAILDGTFQP